MSKRNEKRTVSIPTESFIDIYTCDKCGAEAEAGIDDIIRPDGWGRAINGSSHIYDLCSKCAENLSEWITQREE